MGAFQKRVHGLSLEELADKPTFKDLWPEIGPYIENEILVAHNTTFDLGVLRQLGDYYELDVHYLTEFCTLKASPECWPTLENYKLASLCAHLGIPLDHHNAASDALACAHIAIQISQTKGLVDLATYASKIQENYYDRPQRSANDYFKKKNGLADVSLDDLDLPFVSIDYTSWTWAGKKVLITGTFARFPDRASLATTLQASGAKMISGVSKSTNVIIIGQGAGPAKLDKLKKLIDEGYVITLFNESMLAELNSHLFLE
jgi:DNA polymerase-3 subunit epsilon